jgi:flagellin
MSVINTNVSAMFAQNALKVNERKMSSAMEQLSTGSKVNSAKDDAAGLAISQTMTTEIRGLSQAVRNANDGVTMLQTAEGAMVEQTNMLQRMRELAVQATTATYSSAQLGYMDKEFQALDSQIQNISQQTKWNDMAVLSGNSSGNAKSFAIVVGKSGTETVSVSIANVSQGTSGLGTTALAVNTQASAVAAIAAIDTALGKINGARADIGAGINQLTYAADNMSNVIQNTSASRSQIMDTDYATATTQLARSQIIQQAGTAMLAQANQQPQSVLALLK